MRLDVFICREERRQECPVNRPEEYRFATYDTFLHPDSNQIQRVRHRGPPMRVSVQTKKPTTVTILTLCGIRPLFTTGIYLTRCT